MKPVVFYRPEDTGGTGYVHVLYFESIMNYLLDQGISCKMENTDIGAIKDSTVLTMCEFLNKETILILKENGNFICSFDITDSSQLYWEYNDQEETKLIDLIMKFSGIQQTKTSPGVHIDNKLNYSPIDVPWIDGRPGIIFNYFFESNRIHPLPHVPWTKHIEPPYLEWKDKNSLALIRGGHHGLRFHLYLHLLFLGKVDAYSAFQTHYYWHNFCDNCKEAFNKYTMFVMESKEGMNCTNLGITSEMTDEELPLDVLQKTGYWNNTCVPPFFWLADKFQKKYGNLNIDILTHSINGKHIEKYTDVIQKYMFYCDYKWVFSVAIPPRFWEAANIKTVSMYPSRTADQLYYPNLVQDEHYVTFNEDFSELNTAFNITQEKYEYIANNAHQVYLNQIKGDKYRISVTMIKYILDTIENTPEV